MPSPFLIFDFAEQAVSFGQFREAPVVVPYIFFPSLLKPHSEENLT